MEHRVAVRAYRTKVLDWINNVFSADCCQVFQMVDVHEAFPNPPVNLGEIEAANDALKSIVVHASLTGFRVTFVCVD